MVEEEKRTELGELKIANEVVGIIAGLAATEIDGVAGMSGGLAGGIAEMLGRKNLSKGVKIEDVGEHQTSVELFLVVKYGVRIPEVAKAIQQNVKQAIEVMTGLDVLEVNIHILGIQFPQTQIEEDIDDEEEANLAEISTTKVK